MKILFTTLLLCGISTGCFSQHSSGESLSGLGASATGIWTFVAGNYNNDLLAQPATDDPSSMMNAGLPVSVDALLPNNILFYKQLYDNGFAGRLGLWMSRISASAVSEGPAMQMEYSTVHTSVSSMSFGFSGGMEKHMGLAASKMDPYFAADLVLSFMTGLKYNYIEDLSGEGVKSDSYVNHTDYSIEYPGGIGASLNMSVGFNYFFTNNLSIGGEAGAGLGAVRIGGDWVTDYTGTSTEGESTATSSMINNGDQENSLTGLSLNSFGSVNLIFYW